jgi:hypothetical protein
MERAKADEINRLDFHFPAVTAGLAALPCIRDVAALLWIRSLSCWAKHFPMHNTVSSRLSVKFLRIWLPPFIVGLMTFAKEPAFTGPESSVLLP